MSLDDLLVEAGAELDRLSHAHTAPHKSGLRDTTARRWAGAAAALALVGTIVGVFALVREPDNSTSVSTVPTPPATDTPSTVAETTSPPTSTTAAPTTTVVDVPVLTRTLSKGMFGNDVAMVKLRLADLGFFVGPIDGQFGTDLQQAVWAFKKLIGGVSPEELSADNAATTITEEVWAQMAAPLTIEPRRPQPAGATHVEIYLPQQVLVVFTDNVAVLVAHISSGQVDRTGQPQEFCEIATYDTDENGERLDPPVEKAICLDSKTPGGVFKVTRKYEDKRVSPLGGMYKPVYFNYGIAVHGAQNVPSERASRGAVRISVTAADSFSELVDLRDYVVVWGEDGRDPEQYTKAESLPSFNRVEV